MVTIPQVVMKTSLLVSALFAAFLAVPVSATPITIVSEAGQDCIFGAGSGMSATDPCTTVEIGPHPAWQSPDPTSPGYGGVWVSYDETGYDGTVVAPTSDLPIFSIIETVRA
jgi:hypothetical protein